MKGVLNGCLFGQKWYIKGFWNSADPPGKNVGVLLFNYSICGRSITSEVQLISIVGQEPLCLNQIIYFVLVVIKVMTL